MELHPGASIHDQWLGEQKEIEAAERFQVSSVPTGHIRDSANADIGHSRSKREQSSSLEKTDPPLLASTDPERAQREANNWKTGFLRLSPELRNRIYQDTIPTSTRISVVSHISRTEINLLQLCRAIRQETVPIFYGNATFTLDLRDRPNFQKAKKWLQGLSPDAIASLRKIYFQSDFSCGCKGTNKNDKSQYLSAWVDMERVKWYQHGYNGCRHCYGSAQERAKSLVSRIARSVEKQSVRRQDLEELIEVLRPIRAFEFSFAIAKDGEGKATFETRANPFGSPVANYQIKSAGSSVMDKRSIKQPRTKRRSEEKKAEAKLEATSTMLAELALEET